MARNKHAHLPATADKPLYFIVAGRGTGLIVAAKDLVPVESLCQKNVKILLGKQANKHVQVVDFVPPDVVLTLNGTPVKVANTTLIGLARDLCGRKGGK